MRHLLRLGFVPLLSSCTITAAPAPVSGPPAGWQQAPVPQQMYGGIEIVTATYGGNCGAPRGNAVAHLASACAGQPHCSYRVDFKVIGDPVVGCRKDYVAEWRCSGSPETFRAVAQPEAGFGAVVQLACTGAVLAAPAPAYPPPPSPPPAPPAHAPPPPPSPPVARAIHVVAGSYGQNCRTPRGNKTPHLHQACEGKASCAYRVDHTLIGDPAYGCQKDYVAEWTCGGDPTVYRALAPPEAGFGSTLNLGCEGGAPPPPSPPPAWTRRGHGPIVVRSGSYGPNCGAPRGNVTQHLAQSCDGRIDCSYRVDFKVIGDPAYGCQKDYVAEWTCGGQHHQVHRASAPPEAGFGAVVELRCR